MPFDRFMIAPINSGWETYNRPWLIPDDAFAYLGNAFIFRGRVKKRFGSELLSTTPLGSRLRINLGNITGPGTLAVTVPGALFAIGQSFSTGAIILTSYQANGALLTTSGAITGTYNTANGALTIAGGTPGTPVYFYPQQPVMGLIQYDVEMPNAEPTYAFDTQFAYQYVNNGWDRLGTALWSGGNTNFFWGATYRGSTNAIPLLFVSNFYFGATAPLSNNMYYYNANVAPNWTAFQPAIPTAGDATLTILTARIILPFRNRLILLNTVENSTTAGYVNTQYGNRCRYSQNGDPTAVNAFYTTSGLGGYIDAPTQEEIITAQFIKDRLIVYFESSTWELVYTQNQILPFVWQQINTELGAESTFSQVPFDKVVLGVGNVGIHACNGSNVERIDQKIPDTIFQIHNNGDGISRIYGIRDYEAEMVYWTLPNDLATDLLPYPNRVLTYNYITQSWGINDDSITCFGYYYNQPSIATWGASTELWGEADYTWGGEEVIANVKNIIAGNQQGFTFIINDNLARNSAALSITNVAFPSLNIATLTVSNHNLQNDDYVLIENCIWASAGTDLNNYIYQVFNVVDANNIQIYANALSPILGTNAYLGAGTIARVSNILINTKQYNFYVDRGRNTYIQKVDFLVDRTSLGEITVDFKVSSSISSLLSQGQATGALIGTSVLETSPYVLQSSENDQDRLWHPVYFLAEGECVQLSLYFSATEIINPNIALSDFQLHAMTFYCTPTSSRLQ